MLYVVRSVLAFVAATVLATDPSWATAAKNAPNPNATITFYDAVGNETLDPAHPQNNSSFAQEVLLAIYDPLIKLNDAGEPTPGGLAESWSYNADLTEFTMKLRSGVVFHDGAKLTADAVKRNLERYAALGSKAGTSTVETVKPIAAIETVGDDTVKLKLKAPNGQMEFWLGFVGWNDGQPRIADRGCLRQHSETGRHGAVQGQVVRGERKDRDGPL